MHAPKPSRTGFVLAGLMVLSTVGSISPVRAQRGPGASPEILSDRRVTFRLPATNAAQVSVLGQFQRGETAMTKDDRGVWSATVGPVAPGVYEYSFRVDGISMIDPGNRAIKPMRAPRTSILEIPADPPALHDFQPVPHGTVHLHWYASKALGVRRGLQVYTPPGYETDGGSERYPVLFLFHGSGDNEATWVAHGHAHWILDNLIAQGRARPMVVVMTDGHATQPAPRGAPESERNRNTTAFESDLLGDVMPLVEAAYRVRKDPANRAIIGLSMGGGQSLSIGLRHLDRFGWVGGMSSAVGDPERTFGEVLAKPDAVHAKLQLLWFACGKEDFLLERNRAFDEWLTARGIRHTYLLTEGDHSWPVWRDYLGRFAPLVFQANAGKTDAP